MASLEELRKRIKTTETKSNKNEKKKDDPLESLRQRIDSSSYYSSMDKEVNDFINTSQSFLNDAKSRYEGMGYKNASSEFTSVTDTARSLNENANRIRNYINFNRDRIGEKQYSALASYLDEFERGRNNINGAFGAKLREVSSYKTEDDYNFWKNQSTLEGRQKWYADSQKKLKDLNAELEETPDFDWTDASQRQKYNDRKKEIKDEISKIETDMRNYERGNYSEEGRYYGSKVVDDYFGFSQMPDFGSVSANRNHGNPTRDELTMYDAMNDSSTWYYDENNILRDAYGNKIEKDASGKLVNQNAQDYAVTDRLGIYLSATEKERAEYMGTIVSGTWGNIIGDGIDGSWDQLTKDEIDIYYYLLNNSGKETADKYLSDMKTELNRRETTTTNLEYVKSFDEAGLLEKIGLNIATVPAQLVSGIAGTAENIAYTLRGQDINPYSSAHAGSHFSNTVRSETAEDINEKNGGYIWGLTDLTGFTAGDVYQSGMSILDSYAAIGIGGNLGGVLLATSAASSEATRLYEQGASTAQIALGSAAAGAAEMVFESLSIDKLINMKDATTVGQIIKNALIQGGIEASEEGFTEIANILTNSIIIGNESDWAKLVEEYNGDKWQAFLTKVKDVANASIGGFLSGVGSASIPSVASYGQQQAQYSEAGGKIMEAEGGLDALKALALDVSGADSKIAKQANKVTGETYTGEGLIGKAVASIKTNKSQKAVGKLYNSVQTEVTTQNKADIAKSLEEGGFSQKSAKNIADAIVARANGEELSKFQKATLESVKGNKKVDEIADKLFNDMESSVNKRDINLLKYNIGISSGVGIGPNTAQANPTAQGKENTSAEGNLTSNAKAVSEGSYEVAEDGKTTIAGQEVTLDGFKKTDDGTIVVATKDNQTAAPGDVTYSSKAEAIVYENYANIETTTDNPVIANMDLGSRSALAKLYSPTSGVSAKEFFLGANHAWWYGFRGIAMDENTLPENSYVRSISKEQRDFAYELGRKAGEAAAITQGVGIEAAYEKAVEKLGGKEAAKAVAKRNNGKVVIEDGVKQSTMTQQQKGSVRMAKIVAEATGANIHVYHGVKEYGKYDTATGDIWLNINAMFTGKSMMAFTLGHELVHMAKQWSPHEFKEFADYLLKQYGKKGVSVESLIQEQMANAKRNEYELNADEAYEEVIADACQRMLLDSDAVQKMAAFKAQNPTRWQQIVDAIKEFIDKIRQWFAGAEPDSMEASIYKEFDDAVKEHLEDKFVKMVMDAGEHMSTIRNAFGKGTVVEVNADGEFTLAKGEDSNGATKFLYNDYTWEKGGRDTLAAALKAEGFSKEDIDAALTIMDGKHKLVKELAKEFPEQDRINQVTITTDLKDGHSVLSALVSNGDYPVNIDLLMVCKKRKAYQRVINRLCETGLIQQATVDALAIAEINKILGKYGFETACLGCFVESRRLRIQEWAETICKEWNAEVKKRNPNAKAFGFGKGEATLTADEVMQLVGELESGGEKNDKGNLNLGQGSAVKRMGVLLDKVPSLRKTLSIEDLITPDGLSSLRRFDSNLFSMVKSRYGSNSPKFVQEFNPYNHELAMYGKVPTEYKSLREYLYAIGGARMQSFSDFIVENWFDYCQIVADLATRKLPMHTYTKEISLAKLFGLTGIKINMSLIPDIDRSLGKEYAGLTRNANGELELIWADKDRFKTTGGKSYMQSINFADAIALQEDPRYSANVGTIAVGVSDNHILMMLDDPRIRMVIPYHSSGMNPIFADLMGTSYYKDYTMFQNTTVKQLYNSKGQKVSIKLDKTHTGKLTSGFQFNEVLQELGDARAAAQAYKDWCADASKHTITIKGETYTAELTPKFDDFSGHENYYKLLEDFNTYDCISEQAAPQGDVQQNYPEDFDKILKAELTSQEGQRQKQVENQAFDKAMGEIETYLKGHTKADTVFYAEQHSVKLSAKDKKLGAEDKKKLADLRKGVKNSMPKTNSPYSYDSLISKPDMVVTTVGENVPKNRADLVHMAKQNAAMVGKIDPKSGSVSVYVKDIGRDVGIGRDGLKHSLDGGRMSVNAPILVKVGEIISNSIRINELTPREDRIDESYVLIGAARNADNDLYIVRSVVNRFTHKLVSLDVLYAINAKKEPAALLPLSAGNPALGTDSTISIAKLLDYVNQYFPDVLPEEVLKHYGHDSRPEGKLGEDALYKNPNTRGMSSRQLLADAFDELVQTSKERELMDQYRNNITQVEEVQDRLQKVRGKIRELTKDNGDKSKIAELSKTAAGLADLIDKYDRKLLELEASKPLRDVLARAKSAAYKEAKQRGEKTMKEYRQQVSERFDRGVEGRRKTEMRHKIQNVVKELNDLLLNESKKRHVPDNLKKAVAGALSIVNMDTVDAEERATKYANLIAKEQAKPNPDQDKIDSYTATMENILRQGEKMGQRLKELRDAYEEIQDSDDPDIANAYDPVIAGAMKELTQTIGNTSIRNMTLDQLSDVYDMYRMVLTRVRDANKTMLENIKESISNLASRVIGEVRMTGGKHTYRAAILDPARKFLWNNLKPVYAMEWIGSSTLTKVFDNVRAGEDTWAKDVTEAREFYLDKSKKYGYDSWDFKKKYRFKSDSGIEFELTLEQILSLYAYSKREQAHDHLRLGGFVFDSNIETYKDEGSKILKYKVNTADAHQITPEILADITGKLTKEQMGFVDDMQEYLSTVMGSKGNEVTSKMYGVKLFKEKFYFPLKSAKQFMYEQNEVSGEVKIKNSGFTNKVVPKANNPVILSNFMDVWSGHVNDMSMYHAFTLPLEDFNRVFNYTSPKQEGQPPVSVEGTIQSAYSPAAVSYVKNLITDLNGGARTDPATGPLNWLMGRFKKGSVFASLSVVVQQPSAVARAAALVDTKYFIGPKVDHKRHKALWEEVKQYAPVAIIKEMGYFDTNMGKSTQDFIQGKEYDGLKEKMKALVADSDYRDEVLSKAPALADEVAWCNIWEAVKREMHDKYPGLDTKSETFLKKAGERFTEVITKTQVYDSVLSRSGNMRSKDTGMKMATSFMAEPTTSINMIADALLQGKRGNRKYARTAIGAVIASQIINSILVSFVYAGRDDDEDETYWEKYIGTLTGETLDSLNPAGYIPFIKDIVSIVQGYDVERSDMAVISDFVKSIENLSNDKVSAYRKVEGFAGSIAQIFGLPVKNIMRDARGIYQTVMSFVKGQQTTKAGIGYAVKSALPEWIGGGDVSNNQQLYESILSGDQTQIARVKGRYKDADAVNSAIRTALRENDPRIHEAAIAWNANDLDEYMRIAKAIIAEKHFVQDDVVMAIRAEANALKPDEETSSTSKAKGLFTAEKFAEAIAQGDQATANAVKMDLIQTAQKNGKTADKAEESFVSSAKTELRELFIAGRLNESKAINALTTFCGDTQEEAEERIAEWNFETEQGFKYDEKKEKFLSGEISASELKEFFMTVESKTEDKANANIVSYTRDGYEEGYFDRSEAATIMVTYGGLTNEEAESKLQYIDVKKQFPDTYVDDAWVEEYYKEVASSGISIEVFIDYRNQVKGITGDNKKEGRMAVINSMPISNAQKDALYYAEGWAASKLWQAPWH